MRLPAETVERVARLLMEHVPPEYTGEISVTLTIQRGEPRGVRVVPVRHYPARRGARKEVCLSE